MANYKSLSDSELISFLRGGDHSAFAEIYRRYHQLLITFALKKLNDEELTKDLVQEVFVGLWLKRSNLGEINNLPAYLTTLTKHKILDLFDHERVKLKYASSLAHHLAKYHISNSDHRIRENQFIAHIKVLIEKLPQKMRHAFVLSKLQNYSNKEIAEKLQTSESNVSKHVHSAMRILKAKLYSFFV